MVRFVSLTNIIRINWGPRMPLGATLMIDSSGERAHAHLACVSDPPESELPD